MTVDEMIKNAMARMIERKLNLEDVTVNSWDEEFIRSYNTGCDTCGYGADDDSYEVSINYTHPGINRSYYYTHSGTFAELIKELDA